MADQREITLYPGDATPKDIVLRSLPAATVPAGTTIYLYQGDATPNDPILRDPTTVSVTGPQSYELIAGDGSYTLTGQVASLLVGRLVGATSGAFSLTVDAAGLVYGRGVAASAGSYSLTVGAAALSVGRAVVAGAGDYALTVGDAGLDYGSTLTHYSIAADGAVLAALIGDANIVYSPNQGGALYVGGPNRWLEPLPPEKYEDEAPKKAVQIIKRVAEKQAEKQEFKLAPLKVAFQRANYKYRPNYADIYRRAYEAALAKLRQAAEDDDEEAILMLM